ERVAEGRVRGIPGSWPQLTSKFWRCSLSMCNTGRNGRALRAQLDTTTLLLVDSLSPRQRSGERVRERGFQLAAPIRWKVPLSPALSPLAPRRERERGASAIVVLFSCAPRRGRAPCGGLPQGNHRATGKSGRFICWAPAPESQAPRWVCVGNA